MSVKRVRGSTWDTSDNLVVNILPDLPDVDREGIIFVSGGTIVNDGAGGWFKYERSVQRSTADGNNIIDPTGTGLGAGCWIRQRFFSNPESTIVSEVQSASAGQTRFTLTKFRYTPNTNSLSVYLNGARQTSDVIKEVSATQVDILKPLKAGDVLEFVANQLPNAGGTFDVDAINVRFNNVVSGLSSINVQHAIEELLTLGVGGSSGGATNALQVVYLPVAPDVSDNVQAALHWLQARTEAHRRASSNAHAASAISFDNTTSTLTGGDVQSAIEELVIRAGTGAALDITFNSPGTGLTSRDVQNVIVELKQLHDADAKDLSDHISNAIGAHAASSISFGSTLPIFGGVVEVKNALEKLGTAIGNHVHTALTVTYDNSVSGLSSNNAKDAFDELTGLFNTHRTDIGAHAATGITYAPPSGLSGNTVKAALDEIYTKFRDHVTLFAGTTRHTAGEISFDRSSTGFNSNNVQDAIVEARGGGILYKGNLDLTAAYYQPNWMYSIEKDGALGAGWHSVIGRPPATVTAGSLLIFDGSIYHYIPVTGPAASTVILRRPAVGANQAITPGAPGDSALVLQPIAGQTANLLDVQGKAQIQDLVVTGSITDTTGSLRQTAAQVPFTNTGTNYVGTDVQAALAEIDTQLDTHRKRVANAHPASAIIFTPSKGLTSINVQTAIIEVLDNLQAHTSSSAAHQAGKIAFDNTGNGFIADNVQDAVEEMLTKNTPSGGAAGDFLAKASATDYDVVWASGLDMGTY